jgi:putative CocE/NonD family hydrolase
MKSASAAGRARHYLVIGPWDHAGTRTPKAQFGGLTFGEASLVDLPKLHVDWYAWTMQGGAKPAFLQKAVAYYVMGADRWRYADTLEGVTSESRAYALDSAVNATDMFQSGTLDAVKTPRGTADQYVFDPRDTSIAATQMQIDLEKVLIEQRLVHARRGQQFVYHTAPFEQDTEISGAFKLSAWIAIDQPDTDFNVGIYEIAPDSSSIYLTGDVLRARYRESARAPKLITTKQPLRYDFNHFTFVSRMVKKGSRLRLVISPAHSMYLEKNYNAGGVVAEESVADARTVTVRLFHDKSHPSALYVPIGQP